MSTKPPNQKVKITKTVVDRLRPPASGQSFLRDSHLSGFGVRITYQGAKSFIVEKRINGRVRRMTLGRFGELTVEQARREAQKLLGKVAQGTDPIAEKQKARMLSISLSKAFDEFKISRKNLRPKTLYNYGRIFEVAFLDWHTKTLNDISKAMVAKKHRDLGEIRGEAYANHSMRFLRSLLNFSKATYEDSNGHSILIENPVSILTNTRSWYREKRKQTVIKPHQLPGWFKAVSELKNPECIDSSFVIADYLIFLLFTGLRRQEAAQLLWKNVDLKDKSLTIPDPKNHCTLNLPLSEFLVDLLKERKALAINEYVFPGKEGKGFLIEPKRQIKRVIESSGVQFTIHDLRRTFVTIANSIEIPGYSIKRLVNHKMNGDITARYIISDADNLREPMEKITSYLLSLSNNKGDNKIVFLDKDLQKAASC